MNNKIIELFDNTTKGILYIALQENKNIMFTRNQRSTPIRTKTGIDNTYTVEINNKMYTIAIEPDKKQLEYFDYKILDIKSAIENDMPVHELKDFLKDNSKNEFINAIESSDFTFSCEIKILELVF
jgi:hypothetical protein